jgi:hypothetical protein
MPSALASKVLPTMSLLLLPPLTLLAALVLLVLVLLLVAMTGPVPNEMAAGMEFPTLSQLLDTY